MYSRPVAGRITGLLAPRYLTEGTLSLRRHTVVPGACRRSPKTTPVIPPSKLRRKEPNGKRQRQGKAAKKRPTFLSLHLLSLADLGRETRLDGLDRAARAARVACDEAGGVVSQSRFTQAGLRGREEGGGRTRDGSRPWTDPCWETGTSCTSHTLETAG